MKVWLTQKKEIISAQNYKYLHKSTSEYEDIYWNILLYFPLNLIIYKYTTVHKSAVEYITVHHIYQYGNIFT